MTTPIDVQPVILAGGSGTRLWPLSRGDYPKQLLRLDGDSTMLQRTALRVMGEPQKNVLDIDLSVRTPSVVCGEDLRFLIVEQMRAIGDGKAVVMLEAAPRNTGPAVAAAAALAAQGDGDPVLIIMPADHVIRDEEQFRLVLRKAAALCLERPVIATFGIVPTRADTGLGYIRRGDPLDGVGAGAFALAAFEEKPNAERAMLLLDDGQHYWNAGIFVARASVLCRAVATHAGPMAAAVDRSVSEGVEDGQFFRLDAAAFAAAPSVPFDVAVMERLQDDDQVAGVVVPLDAGWSDVGSWGALLEVLDADERGNVLQGDVVSIDSKNTMQLSTSRLLATVGIDGLVVVETPDAVFVAPKEESSRVKDLVTDFIAAERPEATSHRLVHRPWGTFETVDKGARYQVKHLTVYPGASLSLQMHHHRSEHWVVVSGTARVTRDEHVSLLTENESIYLPVGARHRLENPGKVPLEVIEVQSGAYLGEDDIVRFEDDYDRV